MTRSLTREESKLITRRRLLETAAALLRQEGPESLTTSRIARGAGVAQPTFYVHFADMEALLHALADDKIGRIRTPLRAARRRIQASASDEALRETFRLPLRALIDQAELFRLYIQEYHRPGSPIGRLARELQADLQRDFVEDLVALGVPSATGADRERLEMVAESLIVLTQTLALGYLDGRYTDLEQMVEVLVRFALGVTPASLAPAS